MLFRTVFQILVVSICVGGAYASSGGSQIEAPKEERPDFVGAGGEFKTRFPVDIPEFRGLPLPVSLSYNSSNTKRSGLHNVVGFGWNLNAFSVIERKSVGGGVPTFDDGQDLYLLDGSELMACDKLDNGVAASNPLGGQYPYRYLTDRNSASCLAGGNLSTRIESNRKIVFDKNLNEFTITNRDGVKYIYRSIGSHAGRSTVGDEVKVCVSWNFFNKCSKYETQVVASDYPLEPVCTQSSVLLGCLNWESPAEATSNQQKIDFRTLWLLSRIEDSQQDPNVVTYSYDISAEAQGSAPRLSSIEYGSGYRVEFAYRSYSSRGVMVPKQATGTSTIAAQDSQLRSIRVFDGAQKIRAYQLFHADSALSKAQLVTKIAQYGSDFVVDNHDVVGGSVLGAEEYSYSDDTVSFLEVNQSSNPTYAGVRFGKDVKSLDWERDGTSELWVLGEDASKPGGLYKIDTDRNIGAVTVPTYGCFGKKLVDGGKLQFHNFLVGERSSNIRVCTKTSSEMGGEGDSEWVRFTVSTGVFGSSSTSGVSSKTVRKGNGHGHTFDFATLNLDFDRSDEFFFEGTNCQISETGQLVDCTSGKDLFVDGKPKFVADYTGDGVLDYFAGKYYHRFIPGGNYKGSNRPAVYTQWRNVGTGYASLGGYRVGAGDINQDGLNDIVFVEAGTSSDKLRYRPSFGAGISGTQTIDFSGTVNLNTALHPDRTGLVDVNGDGLLDLIIYENDDKVHNARTWVFVNNGLGFQPVPFNGDPNGFWGQVAHGDFDGDGRLDFALYSSSAKILFGEGLLPNRMTQVVNKSGGVLEVEYTSSSEFNTNRAPGVQLVVKSLTQHDGLGNSSTTSYSYNGGVYDFVNRKNLGYRTVTSYLPPISGEVEGPRVMTIYMNDHLAEYGKVKSRQVIEGSTTTHQLEIYDYRYNFDKANPGNGPYRVELSQSRKAVRYGDELVERTKQYWYDDYGRKDTERDLGFTANGVDLDSADNSQLEWHYTSNMAKYILNLPKRERQLSSFVTPSVPTAGIDRSLWVWAKFYNYDNETDYVIEPQGSGNLTHVTYWDGTNTNPRSASGQGIPVAGAVQTFTYDAHGNVLTETDGRGAVTQHSYDAQKHLFRTSTTNALSQVASTTWSTTCQAPLTQTDINGRVTQFSYDQHCREQRVDQPNGNYVATSYVAIGDPSAQHVVQTTKSGSTVAGSELSKTYSYFDGLGREYMALAPGGQTAITQASKVLKAYDARGICHGKASLCLTRRKRRPDRNALLWPMMR